MEPRSPEPARLSDPPRPTQPIEQLDSMAARPRRPIGEIFVELGLISDEQLQRALEVQHETGARLGEILVEQGSLSRLDLAGALAAHWEPQVVVLPEPSVNGATQPSVDPGKLDALRVEVARLRARLEAVEARPTHEAPPRQRRGRLRRSEKAELLELAPRVAELSSRLDDLAPVVSQVGELGETVATMADLRTNDAVALGARLAHLEASSTTAAGVEAQLTAEVRGIEETLAALSDRQDAFGRRIDDLAGVAAAGRADVAGLSGKLTTQLDGVEERLDALTERAALADRSAADLAELRSDLAREVAACRRETTSVASRSDEILALHHSDGRAARAELDELAGRVETLSALDDLVGRLESRLEGLAVLAEIRAGALESALAAGSAASAGREGGESGRPKKAKKAKKHGKGKKHRQVEQDDRSAQPAPSVDAEPPAVGWLAFAPTPEGFRLLELGGSAPEVGETVELSELDGSLVVTRVGRSPLPFDTRPCAFLDRG